MHPPPENANSDRTIPQLCPNGANLGQPWPELAVYCQTSPFVCQVWPNSAAGLCKFAKFWRARRCIRQIWSRGRCVKHIDPTMLRGVLCRVIWWCFRSACPEADAAKRVFCRRLLRPPRCVYRPHVEEVAEVQRCTHFVTGGRLRRHRASVRDCPSGLRVCGVYHAAKVPWAASPPPDAGGDARPAVSLPASMQALVGVAAEHLQRGTQVGSAISAGRCRARANARAIRPSGHKKRCDSSASLPLSCVLCAVPQCLRPFPMRPQLRDRRR